jgi:CDP-diacylglycerol--serine O-phosphatidyltransferase
LEKTDGDTFHGLPSPGGAAAVCSFVILYSGYSDHLILTTIAGYIPIYAALIGVLMISPIPYAHLGHWLGSKRQNKLKVLALIVFFIMFSSNPQVISAVASTLYVFSGPIYYVHQTVKSRLNRREK